MLKEQYISYLQLPQTLNDISVIMFLHTFNIISLIPSTRKGNYVIHDLGLNLHPQYFRNRGFLIKCRWK